VAWACSCIYHVSEDNVGEEAAWLIVDGSIVERCIVLPCFVLTCITLHCTASGCICFLFCVVSVRLSEGKGCGCGHGWNGIEIPFALFIEFLLQVCTCLVSSHT
jgi:hypothetical protein